jgi:pyruvate dehydrogenase E1 component subunit alpha
MLLIRRFEERTEEQYTRARIGGYCHLAIGEEAANVGAIDPLEPGDYVLASYRDHGTALAVGSEPHRVMAELFGKATGVAGGYGGSMHLLDVERHFLGGWGIVGGQLPIAVGVALALDYESKPNAVLCQLGEGATNIGAFHESLNLAAIWNLPIVFQVINNRYGMGTSVERASAVTELYRHGQAFGIPGEQVDGMDVLAVRAAGAKAVEHSRSGHGPYVLEMQTYRYRGHSMSDPAKYRTKEEVDKYRNERDPIDHVRKILIDEKLADEVALKAVDADVRKVINDAAEYAQHSPEPDPSELWTDVLVEG